MYTRKTFDRWEVQQYTGAQYGWENVYSADSHRDARERCKEYRENQPEYPVRVKMMRQRISE